MPDSPDVATATRPHPKLHPKMRPPWRKGESGNKSGKLPSLLHAVARAAKKGGRPALEEVADALLAIARDPAHPRCLDAVAMLFDRLDGPIMRQAVAQQGLPTFVLAVSTSPNATETQALVVQGVTPPTSEDVT